MYKKVIKTASGTWDDIARQVYGTPSKAGDIAKMNNNIIEGEVLVLEESETEDDIKPTGKVFMIHGSEEYNNFSEYSLFDGMEAIKGAAFIFNKTESDYEFNFGDSVVVMEENGLFLKGRIANIKPNLTPSANWFQIEIKSHAGVLAETVMPYPFEYTNVSIREVLTTVAGYYNQKITFSDESELDEVFTNEIGTSFTAKREETAWNFIKRICHSRGLLLTDTGDGLFIGRYNPDTAEKINLIDGVCLGLEEIHANFQTVGLGRYYEINSQYPTTDTATVQIPFPIPITKRFDSNDFNALDLTSVAQKIACREIGEHFKINCLLSVNYPLKSGDFAILQNKKIKIDKETDFIIESVVRKHPDATILTLTLPCAYTFEIPEELPLCS